MINKTKEKLSNFIDSSTEILGNTKKSLSLLEKETRINFFKRASEWLKNLFGFNTSKKDSSKENNNSTNTPTHTDTPIGSIDYSKVDKSGFTPGAYPFKHIKTPYKGIKAYRVDNIKLNPLIGFSQLSLKGTEGELTTLKVKDQKLHFNSTNTAGYKKNNPCNVSPYKGDIGRIGSSNVADGQNHGKYKTMEDGLASFMKLMREGKNKKGEYMYRNKSIQGINCSGMQGVYSQNEPDSLKALRITRITHACEKLKISPFSRINTDDKETMMAFTQQTAINESGAYFDRATLERAYKKAFG